MVYGYPSAGVSAVKFLTHGKDCKLYDFSAPLIQTKTLSGRSFIKLSYQRKFSDVLCKNTLVAVVIENYLRKKEGISIIPVVFALSSTTRCPSPTAEIANKNLDQSEFERVPNAELRRIYKLCNDPELSLEIRELSKETFKFVHLNILSSTKTKLLEVDPPWETEREIWEQALEQKKKEKIRSKIQPEKLNWRKLLKDPDKAHEILETTENGCDTLDFNSFKEVMVYGYSKAGLDWIKSLTYGKECKLYDYETPAIQNKTLSGRSFVKLSYSLQNIDVLCKNTLVAVLIENYLRKKEGISIIPVVFSLSSTRCPSLLTEWIANKNLDQSGLGGISNGELRRIYKLCNDPELSLEIRELAKETFKFVHLKILSSKEAKLLKVDPPWETEREIWMQAREESRKGKIESKVPLKKLNWRKLLENPDKAHEIIEMQKDLDNASELTEIRENQYSAFSFFQEIGSIWSNLTKSLENAANYMSFNISES